MVETGDTHTEGNKGTVARPLTAPFPYAGGKKAAAHLVWQALGNPQGYVEPFAGSAAVFLRRPFGRPPANHREILNDADGLITNAWRAIKNTPEMVALHASDPINEIELHSRERWLMKWRQDNRDRLIGDPFWSDPRAAGWWISGQSASINDYTVNPGMGVPNVARTKGVYRNVFVDNRLESLARYMELLADRLTNARIVSGSWERCIRPSMTLDMQTIGVFLDPPYSTSDAGDDISGGGVYGENTPVSRQVREWCIQSQDEPVPPRVVLAGHLEEHESLATHGWRIINFTKNGRWVSQGADAPMTTERLFLSPGCNITEKE